MCPHDEFEIIFYEAGVMVRRCIKCGTKELKTERWVDFEALFPALKEGVPNG